MRDLGKGLSIFVVVFAVTGFAAPKTLIMGTGDCTEEVFARNMKLLTDIAQKRGDIAPIQLTPLFEKRKLLSPKQAEEAQRILETVHSKILSGDHGSASRSIQEVLDILEKTAPSVDSWQLAAKALAMRGLALSTQKKARASEEAFAELLRLEADFQLDPFIFPPTLIQSFERLREEVRRQRKARLEVTSVEGATVFIDGAPLGATPLAQELLPGSYRVVLEKDGMFSSPTRIHLSLERTTSLDIPFEWEAAWIAPHCMAGAPEGAEQMGKALGADYLLRVKKLSASAEGEGLGAELIDIPRGQSIREGGIHIEEGQEKASIEKLVAFIVSGKLRTGEEVVLPVSSDNVLIPPLSALVPPEREVHYMPPPVPKTNTARIVSWVCIGTGSALGIGGGLAFIHSLGPSSSMKQILKDNGGDVLPSEHLPLYNSFSTQKQDRQKMAIILGAAGAASLATGLILFFTLPPKAEASPSLSIAPHFSADGGGLQLMGRF